MIAERAAVKPPACSVVHALERRVRLRAPALAGHRGACEQVAEALAREPGCDVVSINPTTGSVLIESGEATLDREALRQRVDVLLGEARDEAGQPLSDERPAPQPGPTRVARAVAHAVAGINADVRATLDNRADLGTILPVIFVSAGLAEVLVTRKLPVPTWFNLLWWSLRSFMTFNISAVEEETRKNGAAAAAAAPAAQPEGLSAP